MEQEQVEKREQSPWIARLVKILLIVVIVASFFALAGVVLGAINYTSGPMHYSAWILASWLVANILFVLLIIAHLCFYTFLFTDGGSNIDEATTTAFLVMTGAAFFGGGWLLLAKHFAWVSLFSLIILLVFVVLNTLFLIDERKKTKDTIPS